jgi:arsenite methyltransferase
MSGGQQFNEETSRKVEALYLTPDVVAQRCQVLKTLELREDERVLDVGSGPGLLAYDMAASVGRDGRVCGIDISEDMLKMSRRRCPIPIIVSMPLYQLRFTNTLRIFR